MRGGRQPALVLATTAVFSACTVTPTVATRQPPPQVEFAGCYAVTRGPICHLTTKKRTLSLWWPEGEAERGGLVTSTGPLTPSEEARRNGGHFVRADIPVGATWLELTLGHGENMRRWRLELGERESELLVDRALALRGQGKLDDAVALLQRAAAEAPSADRRLLFERSVARLWMDQGRNDEAIELLTRSSEAMYGAGELSLAIKDAFVLSILLLDRKQEYQRALEVLARALTWAKDVPELIASIRINEGGVGMQTGNLRAALTSFQEGHQRAFRLGVENEARAARRYLAVVLKRLGRESEALVIQRELLRSPATAGCERSDDLVNLALNLLARSRRQSCGGPVVDTELEDPAALLADAEQHLGSCPDRERLRNILLERWLLALERGRRPEAESIHARLRELPGAGSPLLQVWREEGEARRLLASGHADEAARRFVRQGRLARTWGLNEERLRAAVGEGEALVAAGRRREAIAAYRRAEQHLETMVDQVPLGEGQHAFTRSRTQSAEQLVRALLGVGLRVEALEAARSARTRATIHSTQTHRVLALAGEKRLRWQQTIARYQQLRAALERENQDWGVTARAFKARATGQEERARVILDEAFQVLNDGTAQQRVSFRQPAPGELLVTYLPTSDRHWIGFAKSPDALQAITLSPFACDDSPASLAEALLAPFGRQIAAARRLTFLLPPELWALDLHALPWKGRPLVDHLPVTYSLDICDVSGGCRPASESSDRPSALVVADPRFDLRQAREEATAVADALKQHYQVKLLAGAAATHQRIWPLLSTAAVFHYAGHARGAGNEGFSSLLPLAEETRLYVGDVLSLPTAPSRVILSACEGARLPEGEGGLSLAHAFVAAGSTAVVAATRPVDDKAARAVVLGLSRAGYFDPTGDPAQALRTAQRTAAGHSPPTDWAAFRVLTP